MFTAVTLYVTFFATAILTSLLGVWLLTVIFLLLALGCAWRYELMWAEETIRKRRRRRIAR